MHTERDGAKENRRSFEQEKDKEKFQATTDKDREKIVEKNEKRYLREHK